MFWSIVSWLCMGIGIIILLLTVYAFIAGVQIDWEIRRGDDIRRKK